MVAANASPLARAGFRRGRGGARQTKGRIGPHAGPPRGPQPEKLPAWRLRQPEPDRGLGGGVPETVNKDAIMALPCQRFGHNPRWKRGSGLGKRDEEGDRNQGRAGTEKREGREGRNDCQAGAEGRGEARRQ